MLRKLIDAAARAFNKGSKSPNTAFGEGIIKQYVDVFRTRVVLPGRNRRGVFPIPFGLASRKMSDPAPALRTEENDRDAQDSKDVPAQSSKQDDANSEDGEVAREDDSVKGTGYWRRRKGKRKNNPSLHMTFKRARLTSDESMSQTKYYFENGLRKVIPYDHEYNTFAKGRWIGKTLGEIYTREFRLYPIQYYDKALKDGRLLVNKKSPTSLDQIVKNNDLVTSIVHRHECPIADTPIKIIADTEDFFAVNKPCSIPIHPVGRFRHNCLISILAKEMNVTGLLSIHRIDRLTSGLTVFARSRERANKCITQIRDRKVEKEYVCRVVGDFTTFSIPENHSHYVSVEGDEVTVSEPLKQYDYKIGVSIVSRDEDAKESITVFKCISTDGKTSVVSCKPKTGRTHQIRIHLQYLGFPILRDSLYNNPSWGEERFKLGPITKNMDEIMKGLVDMKKWKAVVENAKKVSTEDNSTSGETEGHVPPEMSPALKEAIASSEGIIPYRSNCEECRTPLSDPEPRELIMCLHALRYKGLDWEFETPMPEWASPTWNDNISNTS